MVLAMPASATAAYIVLRKWSVWGPGAAIGGLLYGFSPYAIGESLGHLVLVFLVFPPFIVLTVVSIVRRDGSPVRLGIQLGLLVTAQFLTEPEVMATVMLMTIWALVCAAIRYRAQAAEIARACIRPFALAVGLAALLLAYPIWLMFAGPQHYTGTAQPAANPYYNDVMSFIAGGRLQRVALGIHFAGVPMSNPSEAGGFIGIPILLVAGYLAWRSRRSPRMQLAVAVMLGAVVLSLGSHLTIDGWHTGIPLPYLLVMHLPLLDNLLPVRISMETAACLAAVIAFGLDDVRRAATRSPLHGRSTHRVRNVVLPLAVLAVVVVTQLPKWPNASQPVRPLPPAFSDAIPAGDPITVTYPIASPLFPQPMLWQALDGFRFQLVGGYAEHPDPNGAPTGMPNPMRPTGLDQFLEGQEAYNKYLPPVPVTPALVSRVRNVAAQNDVRLVIVDRSVKGARAVTDVFSLAFGPPQVVSPSYVLWASSTGPL